MRFSRYTSQFGLSVQQHLNSDFYTIFHINSFPLPPTSTSPPSGNFLSSGSLLESPPPARQPVAGGRTLESGSITQIKLAPDVMPKNLVVHYGKKVRLRWLSLS